MEDFTTEAEIHWMNEGIAYGKKNQDYPYSSRSSPSAIRHRTSSSVPVSNLPRVLDESGSDVTPKPLFPVFVRKYLPTDTTATSGILSEAMTETTIGHEPLMIGEGDGHHQHHHSGSMERLKHIAIKNEDEEEKRRIQMELEKQMISEEISRMWQRTLEGSKTWKKMMYLLLNVGDKSREAPPQRRVQEPIQTAAKKSPETSAIEDEVEEKNVVEVEESEQQPVIEKTESYKTDETIEALIKLDEEQRIQREEELKAKEVKVKDIRVYHKKWADEIEKINPYYEHLISPIEEEESNQLSLGVSAKGPTTLATGTDFDTSLEDTDEFGEFELELPMTKFHIEYARKTIILTKTETFVLLDQPDTVVMPEWSWYARSAERNAAYENKLIKYSEEMGVRKNASVQTMRKKYSDKQTSTGHLPGLRESGGMIDEYCLYETYVGDDSTSGDERVESQTALVKGVDLKEETLIKYLSFHEKESMEVLLRFEEALNQNSYGELLSACNRPSNIDEVLPPKKKTEEKIDLEPPDLKHLLTVTSYVFGGKKHSVTCICFNPSYPHYFAAGFDVTPRKRGVGGGDGDIFRERDKDELPRGCIICWNIRHIQIPEAVFRTPAVVTCLEFSKDSPYMLAAGMKSGFLALFDISSEEGEPFFHNYESLDKPYGDINRIRWASSTRNSPGSILRPVLICVSADGKFYHWSPGSESRGRVLHGDLRSQKYLRHLRCGLIGDVAHVVNVPYLCLDVSLADMESCLVGCLTGRITQCDLSGRVIRLHRKHHGPVYEVKWSPLVDDVFISCGFDSSVCLWESSKENPSRVFIMHPAEPVLYVDWSNNSSTLFGAVTSRKIKIFDLSLNMVEELLDKSLSKTREKYSCIAFFPHGNWFFVGRTDGIVDVYDVRNVPTSHADSKNALKKAFLLD